MHRVYPDCSGQNQQAGLHLVRPVVGQCAISASRIPTVSPADSSSMAAHRAVPSQPVAAGDHRGVREACVSVVSMRCRCNVLMVHMMRCAIDSGTS